MDCKYLNEFFLFYELLNFYWEPQPSSSLIACDFLWLFFIHREKSVTNLWCRFAKFSRQIFLIIKYLWVEVVYLQTVDGCLKVSDRFWEIFIFFTAGIVTIKINVNNFKKTFEINSRKQSNLYLETSNSLIKQGIRLRLYFFPWISTNYSNKSFQSANKIHVIFRKK